MAERKSKTASKTIKRAKKKVEAGYKVVMSVRSPSLNYTAKRLGDLVSEEMAEGWSPHGTPMIAIDEDQYVMSQAMIRE
tara:strand:- start:42 stop:278 length:237 start_codon:yes stop_codon:yes gene_type:complete